MQTSPSLPVLAVRAGASANIYVLWRRTGSCSHCWELTRSRYDFAPITYTSPPPNIRRVVGNPTGSVDQLVFADTSDGMALEQSANGPDVLYVTHDAARTWTRWSLPNGAQLMDLIAAPGGFFATERICRAKPWRCVDTSLLRAGPTASRWIATPLPDARSLGGEMVSVGAWRHDLWITGGTTRPPFAFLSSSTDDGAHFTTRADGALMSIVSCSLEAMSGNSLWAQCLGGHAFTLLHSSNVGRSWRAVPTPAPNMQGGGFAPISTTTGYLDLALTQRLYLVGHDGTTLTLQGPSPFPLLDELLFVGAEDGLAVGQTTPGSSSHAAFTRDGGRHWTIVRY